MSRKRPARN
jgi:hypothetical protein